MICVTYYDQCIAMRTFKQPVLWPFHSWSYYGHSKGWFFFLVFLWFFLFPCFVVFSHFRFFCFRNKKLPFLLHVFLNSISSFVHSLGMTSAYDRQKIKKANREKREKREKRGRREGKKKKKREETPMFRTILGKRTHYTNCALRQDSHVNETWDSRYHGDSKNK